MFEVGVFILGLIVGVFLGILLGGLAGAAAKKNREEIILTDMLKGQPETGQFKFQEPTGIRVIEDDNGLRTDPPPPAKI